MKSILLFCFLSCFAAIAPAQVTCVKGDCYNGQGVCVYPSGARYSGEFRNGRVHGQGTLEFSNGDRYIGNWVDDHREGEGRLIFANGGEYRGAFHRSRLHGLGTMRYANGDHYEGQWRDDVPHGEGVLRHANGDRYQGGFQEGKRQGEGIFYYAGGLRYQGQWLGDRRHGKGAIYLPDGTSVDGQWIDDQFQADWGALAYQGDTTYLRDCNLGPCTGLGKFRYPNGVRYAGELRNGRPHGVGSAYYPNGDRYDGQWRRDSPNGQGVMHYAAGGALGAIWENGQPAAQLFVQSGMARTPALIPATSGAPSVKIWAVVIGAAHYKHMPTLRYTDDDAYQIYAFLKSPEGGALPDEQVRLLIDEAATLANITEAMHVVFRRAGENDVILLYFSGHGLPGAFLPIDFDGKNNRLEHETIKEALAASRAKHKLVLADACHSGSLLATRAPLSGALNKFYQAFTETQGGTALMMSSKGEEYSLEDGGLRSGIFSHFLVKGLKGAADVDNNRIVTIDEIFNYVYEKVRQYTGNIQTPTLTGSFDKNMPVAVVRH